MAVPTDSRRIDPQMEGSLRRWLETQLQDRSILPAPRSPIRVEKAGPISDADFVHPPPPYTMGLDTTNDRLYVKYSDGTWHFSTLT
jgi:hypothetical protein